MEDQLLPPSLSLPPTPSSPQNPEPPNPTQPATKDRSGTQALEARRVGWEGLGLVGTWPGNKGEWKEKKLEEMKTFSLQKLWGITLVSHSPHCTQQQVLLALPHIPNEPASPSPLV